MLQDRHWPGAGAMRRERHFDGRELRCFAERPATLDAVFRAAVARWPDAEAMVTTEARITYAELARAVDRMAGNLSARGLRAGDRLALFLGNCPEFLVVVLAAIRLGAVTVPIGTRQKGPELEFLLNDSGAVALVFDSELAENVPPMAALPQLRWRFVVGEPVAGAEPLAVLLAPAKAPPTPVIAEEETAVILYTSGTTGRPKGALLSHLGIIHTLLHFERCLGLGPGDRSILAVPASHVTGLVAILLAMVHCGGCTVIMRNFKARDYLALASRERVTYTVLVPAMYILCLMDPDFDRFDLGAWRIGAFGGAPMPEATIATLAEKLPKLMLVNAYGATETTSPTTIMPPGAMATHRDSVGQVVPCGELRVVDEQGRDVPAGSPGEIWIRGPMVVRGYWNRPDANAANFSGGFWHSGDIGSIDAEGYVRVFDRVKDMINRGGFKIFSAEVENSLSYHPGVVECAVIGRADPVLGERVQAFILPRDNTVTAEEIRRFCAARMADYKVPEIIELVREPLPRNANGKVQKGVLRQWVLEGRPPSA